jgi:hypothetical protein
MIISTEDGYVHIFDLKNPQRCQVIGTGGDAPCVVKCLPTGKGFALGRGQGRLNIVEDTVCSPFQQFTIRIRYMIAIRWMHHVFTPAPRSARFRFILKAQWSQLRDQMEDIASGSTC